mmetsp:Transcript_45271/g.135109  ORF Transcript_45271/g.135109 Transcript_45271/m.135109 type:complete len:255 (-) Transcript_45271:201-965(-)
MSVAAAPDGAARRGSRVAAAPPSGRSHTPRSQTPAPRPRCHPGCSSAPQDTGRRWPGSGSCQTGGGCWQSASWSGCARWQPARQSPVSRAGSLGARTHAHAQLHPLAFYFAAWHGRVCKGLRPAMHHDMTAHWLADAWQAPARHTPHSAYELEVHGRTRASTYGLPLAAATPALAAASGSRVMLTNGSPVLRCHCSDFVPGGSDHWSFPGSESLPRVGCRGTKALAGQQSSRICLPPPGSCLAAAKLNLPGSPC